MLQGALEVMKKIIMKDYETIETLLKSLNITAVERELHEGLIEECLENERKITEYTTAAKKNIERISTVLGGIYNNMIAMEAALENMTKGAEDLSLRMLPSDKFYHE